jgi:hypothetical protein
MIAHTFPGGSVTTYVTVLVASSKNGFTMGFIRHALLKIRYSKQINQEFSPDLVYIKKT